MAVKLVLGPCESHSSIIQSQYNIIYFISYIDQIKENVNLVFSFPYHKHCIKISTKQFESTDTECGVGPAGPAGPGGDTLIPALTPVSTGACRSFPPSPLPFLHLYKARLCPPRTGIIARPPTSDALLLLWPGGARWVRAGWDLKYQIRM